MESTQRNRQSKSSRELSHIRAPMFESLEARRLMTSVVVNTTVDAIFPPTTGLISLRSAIATANASTSPTTITFSPTVFATPETIVMNGNQLELSSRKAITITGPSVGVTLSGNTTSGVFTIDSGVTGYLTNLTITKGSQRGIVNNGTLVLTNSTVSDCNNPGDEDGGGGLRNAGAATLTDDTLVGNSSANVGGAIYNTGNTSTLSLTNVTIANNTATTGGAGIANGYDGQGFGTTSTAHMNLTNVTVVGNAATGGQGGGIYSEDGSPTGATIANSVIAGNTATGGSPDTAGFVNSIGFNLVGETDGSHGYNAADITGTVAKPENAKLNALANNGGLTLTMLPQSGSPLIGAGLVAYVPTGITTDQRGLARISNGKVDIGAVEVQSAITTTITVTPPAAQTATVGVSKSFTLGSFTETNATGPYTATIVWGDGTANSTIKLTAAGTIPATAHTFAKTATDTVSITVADSAGHISKAATFSVVVSAVVNNAVISGTVFNDANGDKKFDDGELGLGGYVVFIDLKGTGKFATGDPTATTAYDGTWSFTGLAAGTYKVMVEPVTIAAETTPTVLTITLKAGATSTGNLFGEKAIA